MKNLPHIVCIEEKGRLVAADRQKHHAFPFVVPPNTTQLRIHFRYPPGEGEAAHNLLTLSLYDELGTRGAGHRRLYEQEVVIGRETATRGFLAGPINAGEWLLQIDAHEIGRVGQEDAGCEYELIVVAVPQDGATAGSQMVVLDPRKSPPGPSLIHDRPGWYKGDLHSHSIHCDGQSTLSEMGNAAVSQGLDFLGLTTHNTLSWLALDGDWPVGLLPIRGMECTTFFGHANVWGIHEWIDWRTHGRGFAAGMMQDQVERQGALFSINHPCAVGNPYCTGCQWDYVGVDFSRVDCLEVWNGKWRFVGNYNESALQLWTDLLNEGYRMTAVSGTDNHEAEQYQANDLPFTWVYSAGLGEEAILEGIRKGRVVLSSGPELYFNALTGSGFKTTLPGEELPAGEAVSFEVEVRQLAGSATLWFVCDGTVMGYRKIKQPADTVEFEAVEINRWCRLELRQGDKISGDLLALTNPLYGVS